ncbi:hypothetical protein ARMSODRAFT_1009346 [Armillaria solidipes]|uniref:Uncharacterized protein n=1 Tax=Armillaria solidipes TaxID=1076256 RepID=A0A2H3AND1_9AGAR|nr:hypothetical protein ARMSODRAFT_1009346 [Armillaria solidipes]
MAYRRATLQKSIAARYSGRRNVSMGQAENDKNKQKCYQELTETGMGRERVTATGKEGSIEIFPWFAQVARSAFAIRPWALETLIYEKKLMDFELHKAGALPACEDVVDIVAEMPRWLAVVAHSAGTEIGIGQAECLLAREMYAGYSLPNSGLNNSLVDRQRYRPIDGREGRSVELATDDDSGDNDNDTVSGNTAVATPREKELSVDPDVDLASSSLLDLVLKGLCPLQTKFLYYPQVIIMI